MLDAARRARRGALRGLAELSSAAALARARGGRASGRRWTALEAAERELRGRRDELELAREAPGALVEAVAGRGRLDCLEPASARR